MRDYEDTSISFAREAAWKDEAIGTGRTGQAEPIDKRERRARVGKPLPAIMRGRPRNASWRKYKNQMLSFKSHPFVSIPASSELHISAVEVSRAIRLVVHSNCLVAIVDPVVKEVFRRTRERADRNAFSSIEGKSA